MSGQKRGKSTPSTKRESGGSPVGRTRFWWGMAMVLAAVVVGIAVKCWVWSATETIRFSLDYRNGYFWGSEVVRDARLFGPQKPEVSSSLEEWQRFVGAFVGIYDRVTDEAAARNNDYWLDYPPLRLLVMSLWTKHVRAQYPDLETPNSEHVAPLLALNMTVELAAAVAMFFLVRCWTRRMATAGRPVWWPGDSMAFGAALLVWLNPASLVNSYGWPQWDIWILPFFILAALAASYSRWFLCGLLLGVAAYFKAQILIVTAFFPLWAFFSEGPTMGFRALLGWATAFVAVASPWLLKGFGEYVWSAALVLFILIPAAWFLLRRRLGEMPWVCGATALAALGFGFFYQGTFSWLEIGFRYGSGRYLNLFTGAVYNLPSLLADNGWQISDPVLHTNLASDSPIVFLTLRSALWLSFLASLVLCGWAMAYHAKRRNPEVLVALAAPWIAMFALLGQMHERYLLWGAEMSAAVALLMPVGFLLYLALSLGACGMILTVMFRHTPQPSEMLMLNFLDAVEPWADLVFPAIFGLTLVWVVYRPVREGIRRGVRRIAGAAGVATGKSAEL